MTEWIGAGKLILEYHRQKFMGGVGKPIEAKDAIPYWVYDSLMEVTRILGSETGCTDRLYDIHCRFDEEELTLGYKIGADIIKAGRLREGDSEEAVVESLYNIYMVNKLI